MELKEAILTRRSVRKFKADPVDKKDMEEIMATAIQAPSAGNQQTWRFVVVSDKEVKAEMGRLIVARLEQMAGELKMPAEQLTPVIKAATFFVDAPAVIVVKSTVYRSKADTMLKELGASETEIDILRCRPDLQSIGSVIQTLLLAAWEKGYGTCWMTGPNIARPELEAYLEIKEPWSLAALIPIGRPEIVPASRGRKPVEEVLSFLD